MPASPLARGAW